MFNLQLFIFHSVRAGITLTSVDKDAIAVFT